MIAVCVLAVAGLLSALVIRKEKAELATLVIILTGFLIAIRVMGIAESVIEELEGWKDILEGNVIYVKLLIKLIGITYLCEFAANLCKDAGYSALGSHVELFGKISIMLAGLPVIKKIMEMLESIV